MPFDTRTPVYWTDPEEVFTAVHLTGRLAGIERTFGKRHGNALGTIPRIRWELGDDRFKPGQLVDHRAIRQGDDGANELVHIQEFERRECQIATFLYTSSQKEQTRLLIRFLGALSDVLRASEAYTLIGGTSIEPSTDADQGWEYRLRWSVQLLCADILPAATPLTVTASI